MTSILRPQSTNPTERLYGRIAALEERISAIERGSVSVPIITGSPSFSDGGNGSLSGSTTNRLWLKINGTWRYVALT